MIMTTFKPDIKLSSYQEAIVEKTLAAIKTNQPVKIAVNAVAGSGKSTTVKYIALFAENAGLSPDDIRITVFGKKNAKDLKEKLGLRWEQSIGTLHSTGFSLLQKELGGWSRFNKIDEYKYEKIARDLKYISGRGKDKSVGSLIESGAIASNGEPSFIKILDLLRLTLKEPTAENINDIIDHFQIENITDSRACAIAAGKVLEQGKILGRQKNIDFTDQIWLPVVWEVHKKPWFMPSRLTIIDECLPGNSLVTLADGSQLPIKDIVENRLQVSVLCYSESTQSIEVKSVTGWHKVPRRGREILKLGKLRATEDHPVFTREKSYIPMAKAIALNAHVLVIDHEKVRSEYQSNPERKIDYHRVATWRCFNQSRKLEGESRECQSEVYPRSSAITILAMEARGINTLGRYNNFRQSTVNGIWGNSLQIQHSDPSSFYRNLGSHQTGRKEKENNREPVTIPRRLSDRSLVHGRWNAKRTERNNSNIFIPGGRPKDCLFMANGSWNQKQSTEYLQGKNDLYLSRRNESFKRANQTTYPSMPILQGRGNSIKALPNVWRCILPNTRTPNEEHLQRILPTLDGARVETRGNGTEEDWVYCLDVADNHNFFADGVLVHNCQDLNPVQLQLSKNLGSPKNGISIYVGDEFQSIMGFSGADCDSWNKIAKTDNAIILPLSVCYRCGSEHIKLVNELFPDIPIKAYEDNHDGEIIQIKEDDLDKYLYKGARNIMVIARKTAPLVSQCIKLISRGIPAQVKGRDIGQTLVREVEVITKTQGFTWEHFAHWIEQYKIGKLNQYQAKENFEQLAEALTDRLEAILAIYEAIQPKTLQAFKTYAEDLFSDTDEEAVIYLSTVHSAKGLERDDVIIIKPDDLPMRWRKILPWQEQQEDNLHYVALTRAKNRLIIAGKCSWYQQESVNSEQVPALTKEEITDTVASTDNCSLGPAPIDKECNRYVVTGHCNAVPITHPPDKADYEQINKLIEKLGAKAVIMHAIQQANLSEIQEVLAILDEW